MSDCLQAKRRSYGTSMSKGLEKILKKIRENPNRKVLRERYLALVSEIESQDERQARMLDLGNVYFNIDPSESMQIAHQVYRQDKKSIKALKLIKLCLDKMGRKGKAEVIDNQIKRLKAELEAENSQQPASFSGTGSEDITLISDPNQEEPGLPPLPQEPENNSSQTEYNNKQELNAYSSGFSADLNKQQEKDDPPPPSSHPDLDYTSPAPSISGDKQKVFSSSPDIEADSQIKDTFSSSPGVSTDSKENFSLPSLSHLQQELQYQKDAKIDSVATETEEAQSASSFPSSPFADPFMPANKPESSQPTIPNFENFSQLPPEPLAKAQDTTKTSKKVSPEPATPLSQAWQADISDPFPPAFAPSSPSSPSPPKQEPSLNRIPTFGEVSSTSRRLQSNEQASTELGDLLEYFDLNRFLESTKSRKEFDNNQPLPDAFKLAFQNWFRLKQPLKSPKGDTLLWEFIQAIWGENPQKEAAVFLSQTNLAHKSEGLWGTFLDGLLAARYFRKAVYEIRSKILTDPNPRWTKVGMPRLKIACTELGFQQPNWDEQEGIEKLCHLLSKQFCLNEFLVVP